MHCAVYKGHRKPDTYLFVEREDDFSRVPESLLEMLGRLELVMTLELTPDRTLAQADPEQVRQQLKEEGYYLQLPPQEGIPV
ncbi:MAG TPA: YcgL domain-containing protein [Thiotrichales bacterium]|nr:YcgL domain-containing protein [Thiotrichales bacterium]